MGLCAPLPGSNDFSHRALLQVDDELALVRRIDQDPRQRHGLAGVGEFVEDVAGAHVAAVDDEDRMGGVRSYAVDPAAADRLWTLSEEMVGASFSAAR